MNHHQLKTGGDPRALPDYATLRDELAKLTHPARPDVDWPRVEQLSLALFRQNGIELQTAAWYTLARTRLAGLAGLNEGLAILEALLTYQWGVFWPQPVHARMEILAGFSQRLQAVLRTLTLREADLPQVYRAEQHLDAVRAVLQRLELKNASLVGELCTFMHNAATRLENVDGHGSGHSGVVLPADAARPVAPAPAAPAAPLVYIARDEPAAPGVVTVTPEPATRRPWRAFVGGMVTMLAAGGAGLWGWQALHPAPASPVPVTATAASLSGLAQMPVLWRQEYGYVLAKRAEPAEAERLTAQWQQSVEDNALAPEALSGWHQGMGGLHELTRRLNALDERKGKYLTGSELKSMVFTITQHFGQAVPAEERLYQLSEAMKSPTPPGALQQQTDMYMNQLLNRYALIKQQGGTP